MLHMRRKTGESFIINDSIRVTVIQVKGRTVQLGLEGPVGTRAFRSELQEKMKLENRQASDSFDLLNAFFKDKSSAPAPVNDKDSPYD